MPIVFVHGVSNRDGEAYRESQAGRDGFLQQIVAPALGIPPDRPIRSPFWGEHGVQFAWNMAVLPNPDDRFESFGGDPESEALGRVTSLLAESQLSGDIVADASTDLPAAVDLLYASAMAGTKTEEDARELAKSYLRSAEYAEQTPSPNWVAGATQDNFADQLTFAADQDGNESFGAGGILDSLKEGLSRLASAAPDAQTALAGRLLRKKLNASVTRFAGDAFVYLARRGTKENPGPIVEKVLEALREANTARTADDDKLLVIAHSFGGEIMYDIATYFDPDIPVACLVTVGSQVGLFEEMKLYVVSRDNLPPRPPTDRLERPKSVKRWLNVFDLNDVLSYRLEPVMSGVSDFFYDTGYSALAAHGGYFMRPSFYKRLAARLTGA